MLRVKKLHPDAMLPTKAHDTDLGYDLFSLETISLIPGKVTLVKTGIACNFPKGYGAIIRDRSGIATKQGVFVVAGIIDEEYSGEMLVAFQNPVRYSDINRCCYTVSVIFNKGDKIAQMILISTTNFDIVEVDELEETERGDKGFGSSGG